MFLLEAPGPKARNSGFVSMNNPDETARNFFEVSREAGINRKRIIIWNAVPWYIGSGSKIRPADSRDLAAGVGYLPELLLLLPKLRGVVLVGKKAKKAEHQVRDAAPHLDLFCSPHPIRKTIRSLDRVIDEHCEKIRSPELHMTRDELTPATIEIARRDWARTISNRMEKRDIASHVLKQKTKKCTGSRIPGNC